MSQYRGFGGGGDDLPDPRVLLEQLKRNLRYILIGAAVVIAVALAFGSFFTVQPEERAVVLRFGSPLELEFEPGRGLDAQPRLERVARSDEGRLLAGALLELPDERRRRRLDRGVPAQPEPPLAGGGGQGQEAESGEKG